MSRVLIIGSEGQIGTQLSLALSKIIDFDNLFLSDICDQSKTDLKYLRVDALSYDDLKKNILDNDITEVYHLAAILSAKGEKDPMRTWDLNMNSLFNILNLAKEKIIKKVFWPSSIAVFGDNSSKNNTPQFTDKEPITVYGISKLSGENWCKYYNERYDTDIRSIRFPGVISYDTPPGGGTTDYAVDIFHSFKSGKIYNCFLKEDTTLPMIYIDDVINSIIKLMKTPKDNLRIKSSYNISGFSMSPKMIVEELININKEFKVEYNSDFRQKIADSWPNSIKDKYAREDWGWKENFDFKKTVNEMITKLNMK
tara:strand:- start:444 stop:1376 length:933 start_codon:yes stop_codon:yes gene_type:complete